MSKKRGLKLEVIESIVLSKRWESYASRYAYAKEIKYEYIMNCLKEIICLLEPVAV